MIFSSITFLVFFTIVFIGLLIIDFQVIKKLSNNKGLLVRHIFLLVASYIFYGWWDFRFCFLMLFLTAVSYMSALWIEQRGPNRLNAFVGIAVPLFILFVFKYYNFFLDSFFNTFHIEHNGALNIILPVGISFYVFQTLSYTMDVYNNKISAEKSFIKIALYISFFPQLVAGPIVKASHFLPQLYEKRLIEKQRFLSGVQIFAFGLFKKVVLADTLSVFVDEVFYSPSAFHWITIVLAIIAYSLQIYLDFSGYSDMAIGCAKIIGYDFICNFNLPYISKNITEFWKRWHISLSTWLQEYLYIPLGGNRKGKIRTYINLMITMMLGGLWHGASWNFVIWGILHGIALCINKIWLLNKKHFKTSIFTKTFAMLITYLFVCFCWIFFRANNLETAMIILKSLATLNEGVFHMFTPLIITVVLCLGYLLMCVFKQKNNTQIKSGLKGVDAFYPTLNLETFVGKVLFFIFCGLTLSLAYTGSNPFIYFQF